MESILLTSQYNTKPDGNVAKSTVNINGNARKIFCCIASVGGGFSFVVYTLTLPSILVEHNMDLC